MQPPASGMQCFTKRGTATATSVVDPKGTSHHAETCARIDPYEHSRLLEQLQFEAAIVLKNSDSVPLGFGRRSARFTAAAR